MDASDESAAKSRLNEWAQWQGLLPSYKLLSISGPDHARCFTACVAFGSCVFEGEPRATKQAAEASAAATALRLFAKAPAVRLDPAPQTTENVRALVQLCEARGWGEPVFTIQAWPARGAFYATCVVPACRQSVSSPVPCTTAELAMDAAAHEAQQWLSNASLSRPSACSSILEIMASRVDGMNKRS